MRSRLLVLGVLLTACAAPVDTQRYDYPGADTSASASLSLACDEERRCGAELACEQPAECRFDLDTAPDPASSGGRLGDRCAEGEPCATGYRCEAVAEVSRCTSACESDGDCPAGGLCWLWRGAAEGLCVREGGLVGAPCGAETDCAYGLFCENRAAGGYCTRVCASEAPCPEGMEAICTRLSGDFGAYCLRRCEPGLDSCAPDAACTKMKKADVHVCFPQF